MTQLGQFPVVRHLAGLQQLLEADGERHEACDTRDAAPINGWRDRFLAFHDFLAVSPAATAEPEVTFDGHAFVHVLASVRLGGLCIRQDFDGRGVKVNRDLAFAAVEIDAFDQEMHQPRLLVRRPRSQVRIESRQNQCSFFWRRLLASVVARLRHGIGKQFSFISERADSVRNDPLDLSCRNGFRRAHAPAISLGVRADIIAVNLALIPRVRWAHGTAARLAMQDALEQGAVAIGDDRFARSPIAFQNFLHTLPGFQLMIAACSAANTSLLWRTLPM